MIYLDTSVLAPLYWAEALSDAIETLLRDETELALSQLVEVEFVSALSRRVRMREIEREAAKITLDEFQADLANGIYTKLLVEPTHYELAQAWISQFNTPLRALDALHLAIAASNGIRLVTADTGFAESANSLGVEIQLLY